LSEKLDLRPNMRVLDLGCGRALSSIFLHREFGVQVWATDLWFSATENVERVRDAGFEDGVFPIHADARSLPFAAEFFDVIVSIDSFPYYGTDDLYLNSLVRLLKPGGQLGIAGAGFVEEMAGPVPGHLREWWTPDLRCLHSPEWWRRHWERAGVVDIEVADVLLEGWQFWHDWQVAVAPDNKAEIKALEMDRGRHLGYIRVIARRRDVSIEAPLVSLPTHYTKKSLLRTDEEPAG
jgi:SAM-dependent methyltransferase